MLPLIFCSFKDNINNAKSFYEIIKIIREVISQIKDIKSEELKKKLKKKIEEIIENLKETYKNNKEFLNELNSLLFELKNIRSVASDTIFHFDKAIGGYIIELIEKEHSKLNQFCNTDVCNIPKKVLKDTTESVKGLNSLGNSLSKVTNSLGIVAESVTAYYTFKDKYEKCKNKDVDAFLNSIVQTGANVGTNMTFSYAGSVLGSFIPIPFVGTIAGAITGSLIGGFVNSLYDFEC